MRDPTVLRDAQTDHCFAFLRLQSQLLIVHEDIPIYPSVGKFISNTSSPLSVDEKSESFFLFWEIGS